MTENIKITKVDKKEDAMEEQENSKNFSDESLKPILPDDEYAAEVAKEDPEELKKARNRLMTLIRIKGRSLGNQMLTLKIQPMVESMSLSDCNNMYREIQKRGMVSLSLMVAKHNKEEKKLKKK